MLPSIQPSATVPIIDDCYNPIYTTSAAFVRGLGRSCFRSWIIVLITVSCLGTWIFAHLEEAAKLVARQEEASFILPRRESLVTETSHFKTKSGRDFSRIEKYDIAWKNGEDHLESLDVCYFKDLCVETRLPGQRVHKYWLPSDIDEPDIGVLDFQANKSFHACMHRIGGSGQRMLGLKRLKTPRGTVKVKWISGTTFGFTKDEPGNHPAAWVRVSADAIVIYQGVVEPYLETVTALGSLRIGHNSCLANSSTEGRHIVPVLQSFSGTLTTVASPVKADFLL